MMMLEWKYENIQRILLVVCTWNSDYLTLDMEAELRSFLDLNSISDDTSSPTTTENEPPSKKQRKLNTDVTPSEDYTQGKDIKKDKSKIGKVSAAQKILNKVDKTE
ncbi:hypothetical protein Btru_076613 [Bulinus truncatus]|nr:hypothetical protein Btru_076613 [Bulinus truncatus]